MTLGADFVVLLNSSRLHRTRPPVVEILAHEIRNEIRRTPAWQKLDLFDASR
jgi:hypothetical protein